MLPDGYEKLEYSELIKAPELRDGDTTCLVSPDTVLMYSIFADYEEFARTVTVERLERNLDQCTDSDGLTSDASTSEHYVQLDDGTEWYICIYMVLVGKVAGGSHIYKTTGTL